MKKQLVFHPILIALFPVLLIYSQNIHLILLEGIIFPILIIVTVAIGLWASIKFILKNTIKSGLISSIYIFLFFSYGHIFNIVESNLTQESFVSIHVILLILYTVIAVLSTYYLVKTNRRLNNFTTITNTMSIALMVFVIYNIGAYNFQSSSFEIQDDDLDPIILGADSKNISDIYYIVMDEYASLRTLDEVFDYDNSNFVEFLEDRGFYVTKNSHSNYAVTFLSLSSTLNMEYQNYLSDIVDSESIDQRIPYQLISNNAVMKNFKSLGYRIYNIDSGWWGTRSLNIADENLCSSNQNIDFHTLYELKQTSIIRSFDMYIKEPTSNFFRQDKRDRINCQFDEITEINKRTEKPVFVFMHVTAPHDPYVFGPNGEEVYYKYTFGETAKVGNSDNVDPAKKPYLDQLIYLTKILQKTIDKILENSDNPPIIIIQSDTGPHINFKDLNLTIEQQNLGRMNIFNAYYFPDEKYTLLHDYITPVNSFRIVLDSQFKTNYGLLDDRVFFSTYEKPYTLIEITDFGILD